MGFHRHGDTPKWLVYKGKIPMKMDDDGGKNPLVNIQKAIENGP